MGTNFFNGVIFYKLSKSGFFCEPGVDSSPLKIVKTNNSAHSFLESN